MDDPLQKKRKVNLREEHPNGWSKTWIFRNRGTADRYYIGTLAMYEAQRRMGGLSAPPVAPDETGKLYA